MMEDYRPMQTIAHANLKQIVERIAQRMAAAAERGKPAAYIPELAKVDVNRFGIAVAPIGGEVIAAGDAEVPFSIQSISKVFTLTLALEKAGDRVWERVGREPSGNPFNSIVQLEYEKGRPRNPFINAGAIAVADILLAGRAPEAAVQDILAFLRDLAGDDSIGIDASVAASEARTGYRNLALANFMRAEGNLEHPVADTVEVYFRHCAIAMTCRQLAKAGRFLAAAGQPDESQAAVVSQLRARRINALMLTCGHYDASGEFAFRVGIPGKSGVGGGILGSIPGIASVAAWCPGLDANGNSVLAANAFEELAQATGWSVFGPVPVPSDRE
jgi:glutaminase